MKPTTPIVGPGGMTDQHIHDDAARVAAWAEFELRQ